MCEPAKQPSPQTRLRPSITELRTYVWGSLPVREKSVNNRGIFRKGKPHTILRRHVHYSFRALLREAGAGGNDHARAGWKTCPTTASKLDAVPLGHRPADGGRH